MVRSPERTPGHQAVPPFQQSAYGMDFTGFQSFLRIKRRENGREPLRQHGLARTRRTAEKDVMAACRRDLHGAARIGLPLDLVEVNGSLLVFGLPVLSSGSREGRGQNGGGKECPRLLQRSHGVNLHALHGRSFVRVSTWQHDALPAHAPRLHNLRQNALHGAYGAIQGQFPHDAPGRSVHVPFRRSGNHSQGDGEVKPRSLLP